MSLYKNAYQEILDNAVNIGFRKAYREYCMEHLGGVNTNIEKRDLRTICWGAVSWYPDTFDTPKFWPQYEELFPMVCPKTGAFTAYKKVSLKGLGTGDFGIATLTIPETAKRSSAFGNKCRASEAFVKDIALYKWTEINPSSIKLVQKLSEGYSIFESRFVYKVGCTVKPEQPFDTDRWNECSSGIHFFMTLSEAFNYWG